MQNIITENIVMRTFLLSESQGITIENGTVDINIIKIDNEAKPAKVTLEVMSKGYISIKEKQEKDVEKQETN